MHLADIPAQVMATSADQKKESRRDRGTDTTSYLLAIAHVRLALHMAALRLPWVVDNHMGSHIVVTFDRLVYVCVLNIGKPQALQDSSPAEAATLELLPQTSELCASSSSWHSWTGE
jgi:hypothetical protein